MSKLPSKPSKLIELALNDLELVEKDSRYVVDMDYFHAAPGTFDRKRCTVCLAGSVIAKTFGEDLTISTDPTEYSTRNRWALNALNQFRQSCWLSGLRMLDINGWKYPIEKLPIIPEYSKKTKADFKAAMRLAIQVFKYMGL